MEQWMFENLLPDRFICEVFRSLVAERILDKTCYTKEELFKRIDSDRRNFFIIWYVVSTLAFGTVLMLAHHFPERDSLWSNSCVGVMIFAAFCNCVQIFLEYARLCLVKSYT